MVKRIHLALLSLLIFCLACEYKLKPVGDEERPDRIEVQRYDRLEGRYLMTGDFSALQQMSTGYPIETRTLIEDVLQLGEVNDPSINSKFLSFYQDTTLQIVLADVQSQYANMDDINEQFEKAFMTLKNWLPDMSIPLIYTQIGALNQSVVVGDQIIGISLDKYLGKNYPIYKRFGYTSRQLESMQRSHIVPDCLSFYLLSLYPMERFDSRSQLEKDLHMGKVMWTVNKAMDNNFFYSEYVMTIDRYMKKHPKVTVKQLMELDDYSNF